MTPRQAANGVLKVLTIETFIAIVAAIYTGFWPLGVASVIVWAVFFFLGMWLLPDADR